MDFAQRFERVLSGKAQGDIVCGDCLDVMAAMPDGCVDLVVTDPPYGVGMGYDSYNDTEENWYKLMNRALPEIIRISKMAILPTGNRYALEWIYKNYPPLWLIIWYKGSTGCRSPIGFNDYEPLHPCPKPLTWATWLIERASNEGDLIFDPFMGSGTTAVAADRLGRSFFGCDISADYVKMALNRISQDRLKRSQLTLL